VQHRQQERDGLAASGLRAREQIASAHRRRNGVGLDGRRTGETEVADPLYEIRVETKTIERQLDGVLTCISKDAKI
jgi:hypothetical protein